MLKLKNQNQPWGTVMASVQWFMFLLASTIAFPIITGQVYQLSPEETSGLMQRTFLVVGLASVLGGWLGHRLPIVDGSAGIWFGIFILMGHLAIENGHDPMMSLQLMEGAMLIAGLILVVLGAAGWMKHMLKLFSPMVNGVYLIILTFQLCGAALMGMVGDSSTSTPLDGANVAISFAVFMLVLLLIIWGAGWLKNYAVLIGMIVGWVLFVAVNGAGSEGVTTTAIVSLPEVFAWGQPQLNAGIFLTAVIVSLVLVSGVIVTISAMGQVLEELEKSKPDGRRGSLERGGLISGVSSILSSVFCMVGTVPYSVSSGFVRTTGQTRMTPFFIGCALFAVASFFPVVYSFLSMLPGTIANAAILPLFAQMVGIGFNSVLKEPLDQRRITILSLSLSLGTGVMLLPQAVFSALPAVFQYILSNGVLVGILSAISLEQMWRKKS